MSEQSIKPSPAMIAEWQFSKLCKLEDKANSSYLAMPEREERARLRAALKNYLIAGVKGEMISDGDAAEIEVPA